MITVPETIDEDQVVYLARGPGWGREHRYLRSKGAWGRRENERINPGLDHKVINKSSIERSDISSEIIKVIILVSYLHPHCQRISH